MIDNNTRRYPRTLGDAFRGPEYANAIETFQNRAYGRAWWACMALVCVFTAGAVVLGR